jgi:hypothetical protein
MENTNPTTVKTYFSYWQQCVQPIEEERIRAQFDEVLIDVGTRLYGVDFALELAYLFLQAQNQEVTGERVVDL